jgi:enoyl-CoA hydratase/carnithine racemase
MSSDESTMPTPVSRVETGDAAPGVRVVAFNRPDVRNAFDTAMYREVTHALRAADSDAAVGAVVLTGRGTAFTSGQDLAEMAAIATGTAVEGAGQGSSSTSRCRCSPR